MRKIAAHYLITSDRLLNSAVVSLDDEGVITSVEENVADIDSLCGVEFYNGVLIPGMINCHCHLEYSYVKGMIPAHKGLPVFIDTIIDIKKRNEVSDEQKSSLADIWDHVMYNEGITAVGDHNNNDYVYSVKKKSRIHYHSFVELFDMDGKTAEETFSWGLERVKTSLQYGIEATISPHANYTMEERLIRLTGGEDVLPDGRFADGLCSVHFKESEVLGGPEERRLILNSISANRTGVLLVHCIYATEEDLSAARDKFGDKLTVVPCPLSNLYIEERLPDIQLMKRMGLRIALGTDSLSSNTVLSMVEEMRCLQEHLNLPLPEVVKYATENGAVALGIDDWAGTIEVGKKPGLVLLSDVDMSNMRLKAKSKGRRLI